MGLIQYQIAAIQKHLINNDNGKISHANRKKR